MCATCREGFAIPLDQEALYGSLGMPLPENCFYCRARQRLAFWPFGRFRKGKSDLSGTPLITIYPEKSRFPIYHSSEWYSDKWEPFSMEYDPNRPFMDQFKELQEKIPRPHQYGKNNTDCDWSEDVWESKRCYLSRAIISAEDISYCYRTFFVKDTVDSAYCFKGDRYYDSTYCFASSKLFYSFDTRDSLNGWFLYDCRNVQDSFMCWNLRNKQYCIRNVQYTKTEYEKQLASFKLGSWAEVQRLKDEFHKIIREQAVHRENFNLNAASSSGNFLTNCNECKNCFALEESEASYDCLRGLKVKNSIDISGSAEVERCGACILVYPGYDIQWCTISHGCRYSAYLDYCEECEYCFGCVGLRNKKYCILNKQYSESEYHALKQQIIETMKREGSYGKFFPYDLAPVGYNLSIAQHYFPETKESVQQFGGAWDDGKQIAQEGVSTEQLPDNIEDVADDIVKQPLICPKTGYRFNIAPQELEFYRRYKIPLPRYHFDYRTLERFKPLAAIRAYPYQCIFCKKNVQAYYPLEWGYQKVACVECYQRELA
jgi:hypothetical protein